MTKIIISPKMPQALTLSNVLEFNQPSTHVNKVDCLKGLFFQYKGNEAPTILMNFQKSSKGGRAGVIFNQKIYIAEIGPLNRAS